MIMICVIGLSLTTNHIYASCATSDAPCNDTVSNPMTNETNQTQWHTFLAVGHYQNTNHPSKSDKLFKTQYSIINGTVDSIENQYNSFTFNISSIDSGLFKIKIPRNYPYNNSPSENSAPQNFLVMINHNQVLKSERTSDCFFEYSIPFSGTSKIEIMATYILISTPYHGDHVIDKCLPQTMILDSPLKQLKTGTSATNILCNEGLQLVVKQEKYPACVNSEHVTRLVQHGWTRYLPSYFLDSNNPNDNLTNHFPNVSDRSIHMKIGSTPHTPPFYLPVTVSDRMSLEEPSDVVVLQNLYPEWGNVALQDKVFTVQNKDGNDVKASFFRLDCLGMLLVSPSKEIQFTNPFHMPIRISSDIVIINYTMPDIGPINDAYDLKFASFYPVRITLPQNSTMISNDTKTYTQFWHVQDNGRVISSFNTTIPFDDSRIPINSVIEYDVTFKLGNRN